MKLSLLPSNMGYVLGLAVFCLGLLACSPEKRKTDFHHGGLNPRATDSRNPGTEPSPKTDDKNQIDPDSTSPDSQDPRGRSSPSKEEPGTSGAGGSPSDPGGSGSAPGDTDDDTPPNSSQSSSLSRELKPIEVPQIVIERQQLHGEKLSQDPTPPFSVQAFLTIDLRESKNEMRLNLTVEARGQKERMQLAGKYVRFPGHDQPWDANLYAVDPQIKNERRVQAVVRCPRKFICDQVWMDIYYVIDGATYVRQLSYGQRAARLVLESGGTIPLPKADKDGYITIPDLSTVEVEYDPVHDANDEEDSGAPPAPPPPRSTNPRRVALKDQTIVYDEEVALPRPENSDFQVRGISLGQKAWRKQAVGYHGRGKPVGGKYPYEGRLVDGVKLESTGVGFFTKPEAKPDVYPETRRWGTDLTLELLRSVFAAVEEIIPDRPPVAVGNLSRKGGGYSGHGSHRSGLDVDIGFYHSNQKRVRFWYPADESMQGFDYERNWAFLKALHNTPEDHVLAIFLSNVLKQKLCTWVKSKGVNLGDPKSIENRALRYIQHWDGHRNHYHVRLKCPPGAPDCRQSLISMPSDPCHQKGI